MNNLKDIVKDSKNLHILYVEDNYDTRVSILEMLELLFDTIVVAVDGEDGLEKFKSNHIDIVITDVNMPNMDGLEMIYHIKQIDDRMPILIFSAYSDEKYYADAIKLGVDGFLQKPINYKLFGSVLSKIIGYLNLRRENQEYKKTLEEKVAFQVKELREKDTLLLQQSKMASMGEMMDVVAHQWKQPINAISMMSELLVDMSKDTKSVNIQDLQEYQLDVKKQIDHLVETLGEFRNFFKPKYNIKKLNLKYLIDSVSLLLKDDLISSQTILNVRCEENIFFSANENDIKHLFINLITNAKEEMLKSDVKSEDRCIDIKCKQEGSEIEILFKDNGNGIPQEIINDIFKANFTTKESNGGSGIGLYMCKQIVEKYGGKIEVSNNNGALFGISLSMDGNKQ